jgi:hypothetical protein
MSGSYTNYKTTPRPTEFLWATNLANLMIDTTDAAAKLWREMSLNGKCQTESIEAFLQNFYSLFHHTSEYMHKDNRGVVEEAAKLFQNDLRLKKDLQRATISNALKVFENYNNRLHHTPAIMKIVEEANTFYDNGE